MRRIVLAAIAIAALSLTGLTAEAAAAPGASSACGVAGAGEAHCDVSLLRNQRSHLLVRPSVRPVAAVRRRAQDTPGVAGQPQEGSPQWLQQAYDLTALSASQGAGDTIAIVDPFDDPAVASDLATFRQTYGLPACGSAAGCLRVVNEQGASSPLPPADPAWTTEETIDVEAASAVCPNCDLLIVEASGTDSADLLTAMQTAANLGAQQISDSWSITAPSSPFPSDLVAPNPNGAVPAVFAASGDDGADPPGEAEFPAALPSVTAVGGTSLSSTDSPGNPRGYSESAWADGGSGCALGEPPLSYQPSTGCAGRAYSDVSADADPHSGLNIYQAAAGGWAVSGGTSLATPIVAAFDAITGINADTPEWAYADSSALNDPTGGSDGVCSGGLQPLLCNAGASYDGPTGAGSVSGAVVAGAPGFAGPALHRGGLGTDLESVSSTSAQLAGGIYSNQERTSYAWQYGTTVAYGQQTPSASVAGGAMPSAVGAELSELHPDTTYHYRLMATNASGTTYGYDMTFTTTGGSGSASSPSADGSGPHISFVSRSTPTRVTRRSRTSRARVTQLKKSAHRAFKTQAETGRLDLRSGLRAAATWARASA